MNKKVPLKSKALYICKVFLLSQGLITKYYFGLLFSIKN